MTLDSPGIEVTNRHTVETVGRGYVQNYRESQVKVVTHHCFQNKLKQQTSILFFVFCFFSSNTQKVQLRT